jgi:polyferredoxin
MRYDRTHLRKLRYAVQFAFLLLSGMTGYLFYNYVLQMESHGNSFVQRPPSVDAFLPIAGLMSFKYFLLTGIIEPVRPAVLIMFIAIVTVSISLKKGFCGWICPVGTVSQCLWMAGGRVFGKNYRMQKYADIGLRSIKYMLMAFFLIAIWVRMSPEELALFFSSDYYRAVDIRTMKFFTEMSRTTFWSLCFIGGFSLVYKNFWCRYLCPYGALLGLLSSFSPVRIKREEEKCIHCGACSRNCPSLIPVEEKQMVNSPECFGCLTCVSHCPSAGALDITVRTGRIRRVFSPYIYPAALVLIFYLVIVMAILTGHWNA